MGIDCHRLGGGARDFGVGVVGGVGILKAGDLGECLLWRSTAFGAQAGLPVLLETRTHEWNQDGVDVLTGCGNRFTFVTCLREKFRLDKFGRTTIREIRI